MPSYLVTGASRGLGVEFVKQLSEDPTNTIFALIRSIKTAKELNALTTERKNIHVLLADIVDVPALQTAAADVMKITGGSLDVLINNAAWSNSESPDYYKSLAALGASDSLAASLTSDLKTAFDINVIGVINTINVFLPLIKKSPLQEKKIISLSTGISDIDFTVAAQFELGTPYCISKAALNMAITKYSLSKDLKDAGIIFLSISPGLVDTSDTPPPAEALKGIQAMVQNFKIAAPNWDGVPISPAESVTAVLKVMNRLTPEDSGKILSHKGNREWL